MRNLEFDTNELQVRVVVPDTVSHFLPQTFHFTVYKNLNELFNDNDQNNTNQPTLNSHVISFQASNLAEILLKSPIEIRFQHLFELNDDLEPICSYWAYDKVTFDGKWLSDGCKLEFSNVTYSICKCNHLTNFAIITGLRDNNNYVSN